MPQSSFLRRATTLSENRWENQLSKLNKPGHLNEIRHCVWYTVIYLNILQKHASVTISKQDPVSTHWISRTSSPGGEEFRWPRALHHGWQCAASSNPGERRFGKCFGKPPPCRNPCGMGLVWDIYVFFRKCVVIYGNYLGNIWEKYNDLTATEPWNHA